MEEQRKTQALKIGNKEVDVRMKNETYEKMRNDRNRIEIKMDLFKKDKNVLDTYTLKII